VRARTLDLVSKRRLPSLDGTVTSTHGGWRVELVVRAPDGAEIARAPPEESPYLEVTMRSAVSRLWHTAPLAPAAIDPDVARWTAFPDIEAGLADLDLTQVGADASACADMLAKGPALGWSYEYFRSQCSGVLAFPASGASGIDESSGAALATSAAAILAASVNPPPDAETRRIALEVDDRRASETSRRGRATLALLAGGLWTLLHEAERGHTEILSAVAEDPLLFRAWHWLLNTATGTGAAHQASALAYTWFPEEPTFLAHASGTRSGDLAARIRDGQLAYILEPAAYRTEALGSALAEAGRAEEVRALIATTPADRSPSDADTATYLLASIDLHDGMLGRALERFLATGSKGIRRLPELASVLGRTGPTAAQWARSFLELPDRRADNLAASNAAALALCMNAGGALAGRCLARVEKLSTGLNSWGVGGDLFLRGASRFAAGDVRGAVDAWRPIVAGPNESLVCLLPTEAFERAGEPDLAARIDGRKMAYRQLAGISEATPREARRAFARGDVARARELATSVVQAWEVADAVVPAVAEMRELLAKMGK